ncbi:MAG: hypothetical protein KF678_03545 [Phycisphaeraceae bacterium]|nr:hypothetical protein [Phycisphaeraceae bacterium]
MARNLPEATEQLARDAIAYTKDRAELLPYKLKTEEQRLAKIKAGRINRRQSETEKETATGISYAYESIKKRKVEQQMEVIAGLKEEIERLKRGELIYKVRELQVRSLNVGAFGQLVSYDAIGSSFAADTPPVFAKVKQVVSPSEVLAEVAGKDIYLVGLDKAARVDNEVIRLPPVYVVGTYSYTTVLGANRTIYKVEVVTLRSIKEVAERIKGKAEETPEPRK